MNLGSQEFWARLREDPALLAAEVCTIDLVNLDATLTSHPALRAWVNASFETVRIEEERARWEVTKARARALLAAKAEKDPDTGKTKTVAIIEAEADSEAAVQHAVAALLDVQMRRAALRAMATALEDRLQMLIQISVKRREEARDYH